MPLFNADQMSELASWFGDLVFDTTCTIIGQGGSVDAVTNLTTPQSGTIAEYASKLGTELIVQASFPINTTITEGDQVVISGETWYVQAMLRPQSFSIFVSALIAKVR